MPTPPLIFRRFPLRLAVALALGLLAEAVPSAAQVPPGTAAEVVGPADDERRGLVDEALAFWNATFRELGLPRPFDEPVVVDAPGRSLETLARHLSQRAGRPALPLGPADPVAPEWLFEPQRASLVLLLSNQSVMPFAWPLMDADGAADGEAGRWLRYLVVAPALDPSLEDPAAAFLQVLVHELGHALGLGHQRDPDALMCMPCGDPAVAGTQRRGRGPFLSGASRRELVHRYGDALDAPSPTRGRRP